MSLGRWADYSGGRPSGAALKAAGFLGVIRYVGIGNSGKRITAAEYRDLVANGLQVLLVAELGTGDAWGTTSDDDYARGRANAASAVADARAMGIPDSVPIFAAADAHAANQGQINDAVAYCRGFRDVLGLGRTGFYGFSETLTAVRNAGVASWFWRCGSQPTAAEQTWTHFWQRNAAPTTTTVAGVQCDLNEQYLPITAGGFLMALTDQEQAELLAAARIIRDQMTGGVNADGTLKGWAGLPGKPDGTLVDMARFAARQFADRFKSRVSGSTVDMTLVDAVLDTNAFTFNGLNNTIDLKTALASVSAGNVDVAALAEALQAALAPEIVKALGEKLVA